MDLVAGSGIEFDDRGQHELKGVVGPWHALRRQVVGAVTTTRGTPTTDDYLAAYGALQERLAAIDLVADGNREVPACPGWQVRHVVAHLAGLCEDWVSQRLDGYGSDAWTTSQVARFVDRSCPEILEAWAQAMVGFATIEVTLLGSPSARWAFGDAVIHEGDIRGALKAKRAPNDAVLLSLRGTLARWTKEVLLPAKLPCLPISTPEGWCWPFGSGCDEAAEVELEVPIYELFRALAGRRAPEQVRQWDWSTNPEPFIQAGLPYPFRWASTCLAE